MIAAVWAWLTSPQHWAGNDGIATRIGEHLLFTAVTIAVAAAVALPVGLWVGHRGRGQWIVGSANAVRAVPSLGLLFAVAMWLGSRLPGDAAFLVPSLLALVVLAIPPLLSGTYAGVESVDAAARDAARGMGMTATQVLWRVEFPCALPLLLSGLRSATLQVIATATIASFISLGGLGVFLVDGLASGDYPQMAGGAILVAALALTVDIALAGVSRLLVSPGLTDAAPTRSRRSTDSTAVGANPPTAAPAARRAAT